jgi:hypothetical protein
MTNVACFCGYLYCFAGDEGPCPQCGAVAVIKAKATGKTNENPAQNEPERPPRVIAHLAWHTEYGLRLHPVVHPILREMLGFVPPEPVHAVPDVTGAWTDRHSADLPGS